MTYLYIMQDQKQLNEAIILEHVQYLKQLRKDERLVVCGPFTDHPGGIVVFHATSKEEALAAGKEAIADKLTGNVIKEIYVPKKIINIVMK